MVNLKHDLNDKDVASLAATVNGFTVTLERLRQQLEDLAKKKISAAVKICGFTILSGEIKLDES